MSNLPEELTVKILLGVPAFDLVRCKAVCKGWRSLISSADFVAAHLERARSDPSSQQLLVHSRSFFDLLRPPAGPFLSFTCFSSPRLLIIGSANGLICVAGMESEELSPDNIWILNPVTGLCKKLPYSSRLYYYDAHYPRLKFAFWCDDDDGVYKVAKFLSHRTGKTVLELWVSTSPDTWTDVSTFELYFNTHPHRLHACDVLIEGHAANWIVVESYCEGCSESEDEYGIDDDDDDDDVIIVVSLDLKTLALTKFEPISQGLLGMRKPHLRKAGEGEPNSVLFGGNLNGEFVLVTFNFSAKGKVYDIWTLGMGDDTASASWIKKYTLRFDDFPFEKCLGIVNHKLVLVLPSCEDQVVALCDPVTGMMEVVETSSKLKTTTLESACGFVGSLVSIHGFGFEWNDILRENMGLRSFIEEKPKKRRKSNKGAGKGDSKPAGRHQAVPSHWEDLVY